MNTARQQAPSACREEARCPVASSLSVAKREVSMRMLRRFPHEGAQPFTAEYLQGAIRYDAETGDLWWNHRHDRRKNWNSRYANTKVYLQDNGRGYRVFCMGRSWLKAHRVAWAIQHGQWPTYTIDHINGDRADNRLVNLRDVPFEVNYLNRKPISLPRKSSVRSVSSGCVYFYGPRWRAKIRDAGKYVHLGMFDTQEEALAALAGAVAMREHTARVTGHSIARTP